MSRFAELKRRNVFRVAALYLVASWLILQVADLLFDRLGVPGWAFRLVLGLLALGFPLALIFSWIYELTPEGLKFQHDVDLQRNVAPDAVRRLDVVTIALLIIAIAAVLADRLLPERATVAPRPAAQAAAAPDLSIAVLPFADLSPGKDQGYFSDGLTEELINLLAKVPQLKVTSRTSAFSLSGQNLDIRTVAKKLNVGHVLEGSVRKSGDRVRINAHLIDARNDVELWSETYERTLDDIFAVQEEIAAAAIAALTPTLVATDKPRAARTDPNAYVAYLRARQLIEQGTVESRAQAVELLLAALAEQPKHAPSWTELGRAYMNQAIFREVPIRFGIEQARAALDRALRVEHGFAPAQAWMGILLEMEWDFAGARQRIQQALLSAPTDELVLRAARQFLQATGRPAQATEIDRWQLVRDPLNPAVYRRLGWDLAQAGRYQEAEEVIRRGGRLNPEAARLHADLGSIRLARGDPQGALQEFELEPNEARRQLGRAMAYHGLDRSAESLAIVRAVADAHPSFAITVAEVYAYRGERDEAFQWLQRALELHDPDIVSLRASLMLMPLQDDARWSEVLERANLSDAQVAPLTLEVKLP